jgi:hypothetical protein
VTTSVATCLARILVVLIILGIFQGIPHLAHPRERVEDVDLTPAIPFGDGCLA